MAAYSYLGQGSQAFVVRADLSLGQLEASTTIPTATYATNGGLWLDTDASKYGIHEWSATNNTWENKIPTVEINATTMLDISGTTTSIDAPNSLDIDAGTIDISGTSTVDINSSSAMRLISYSTLDISAV